MRCPSLTPFPQLLSQNVRDTAGAHLSIASFNLLAELYVRPYDFRTGGIQPFAAFEWISKEDSADILDIESRGERLLASLRSCGADVICLQELQLEHAKDDSDSDSKGHFVLPSWIKPIVDKEPYEIVLPPQSELDVIADRNVRVLGVDAAVTCAILFRTESLQTVEERFRGSKDIDTNTSVMVCLEGKEGSQLASMHPVVVTSIHLDATDERKRCGQLKRCLIRARNFRSKREELEPISALIVGDYNQEYFPGSCITAFLSSSNDGEMVEEADMQRECAAALRLKRDQKPTAKQMKEWINLYNESRDTVKDLCVSLNRVETGETRSAYDHDSIGNGTGEQMMGQWRLDHMLYTSATLQPCVYWATLESDDESCRVGLPNRRYGSDHLPIGALFRVLPTPKLSDDETVTTLRTLDEISERQKRDIEKKQNELDAEIAKIEATIIPVSSVVSESPTTSKKKKKKSPPPQEVIELMRKRRTVLRELKAAHKEERRQWIHTLGDLEQLAIGNKCGFSCRQWAERG